MKKSLLLLMFLFSVSSLFAQWTPVNDGLGVASVTSMFAYVDTIMAGTDGNGIFKTIDNGAHWVDISGNIGNKNINQIHGAGASRVICAATDGGAFFTQDHAIYENNTSNLTTTDVNYYYTGGSTGDKDWMAGTNGGGLFVSGDRAGPWNAANTGVSGNGLIVNDLGGYSDDDIDYAVMATDGGVYFSTDNFVTWTAKNNGLSGDALLVKKLTGLGSFVLIATHGGLFYTLDFGDTYTALIPNERFNTVFIAQSSLSPTGFIVFAFGEKGYYSQDFMNYIPIDMTGITEANKSNSAAKERLGLPKAYTAGVGDVSSVALNSTFVFIGFENGGLFRKRLDHVVPVELASFNAFFNAGNVVLQWETKSETNNYGFEIQRFTSSASGWEKIGFVEGNGTTVEPQHYEFIDHLTDMPSDVSTIQYRLKQVDTDGSFEYSPIRTVSLNIPTTPQLLQNYPNPFNPLTTVRFELPQPSLVILNIYNVQGQKIKELVNKQLSAGRHEYGWNAQNLPGGTYFCVLQADKLQRFIKLILLK